MTTFNGVQITDGCRLGIRPGFQNPVGPYQQGSTPVVVVGDVNPSDVLPPFRPVKDPPGGGDPGSPGGGFGRPGDGGGSGGTTIRPGRRPGGGVGGPSTGGPVRPADTRPPRRRGPTTGSSGGPSTGASATPHVCQELRYVCVDDLELPLAQQRIRSISRACVPVIPNLPTTGVVASGISNPPAGPPVEAFLVVLGTTFASQQECEQSCVPTQQTFSQTCTGPTGSSGGQGRLGQSVSEPLNPDPPQAQNYVKELITQVNVTQQNQNVNNGSEVIVDVVVEPKLQPKLSNNTFTPLMYDPQKNFFQVPEVPEIVSQPNVNAHREIFRSSVAKEVKEMFLYQNESSRSWDENAIQNLTDEKIIFSLNQNLVEAFNNLRDVTGRPIGIESFLKTIRKHLITGTLNEFNPQYYLTAYNTQRNTEFLTIAESASESTNEAFSLLYLRESEFGLETYKDDFAKKIEMGRFRFLNEDVGVTLNIQQLDGESKDLSVANQGIPITLLTEVDASTPASVGAPDLLNIGDGGGYYIDSTLLSTESEPVYTKNMASSTYYAPASVRSSLLELLSNTFNYTITSESLSNQHEFVSGDTGVGTLTPLYFGINLSSVSSLSYNRGSVESYSASYSRITDSASIQQHINNNALSIPQLYMDYRDPLYRYILDSSSFDMRSADISNKGFVSNPSLLGNDNFVKNIPFGFVIIPGRGSDFNPFNSRSVIKSYGDTVRRELTVRPTIGRSINEQQRTGFDFYNLFLDDGSKRVGSFEDESVHNFGYRYEPSSFLNSFYVDGSFGTSSSPVSSYGASYLLKDVMDYIKDEYDPESIVWFDVFSRMPLSRIGELMYDMPEGFLEKLANGYRHGITIRNAQNNERNPVTLLKEDSKTIVKSETRKIIDFI